MQVQEVKNTVRKWVESEAVKMPGFAGAFIFGSVNWMDDADPFPDTSDIDVRVVLDADELPAGFSKQNYDNVLVEVSYAPLQQFQSAESVLIDYATAAHFTRPCIISDPNGHLNRIQAVVTQEFARRKWVLHRIEAVKNWQLESLKQFLNKSDPLHDQVFAWIYAISLFSHQILVADLKNPTVRKCWVASRDVLNRYQQQAFHEKLLRLLGSSNLSREQVEALFVSCTEVFEAAKTVCKTEFFGSSSISDTGYPTTIGGIDELIQQGNYQEAVFWLVVVHTWCQKILHNDAAPDIQARFMPRYDTLLHTLGIASLQDVYQRIEQFSVLREQAAVIADYIMANNPEISD